MASQKLDLNSKDLVVRSIKSLKGSSALSESSRTRTRVLQNELVLQKIYGQITLQGQGIEDASSAAAASLAAAAAAQAAAAAAALIANAAGKVWFQATAPTIGSRPNAINGDRWYDSDDGSLYEAIGGVWSLQTSDVPLDAAAYWPLDEVPEIPDAASGITYRSLKPWLTVDGWTALYGCTLSIASGALVATGNGSTSYFGIQHTSISWNGKTLKLKLPYDADLQYVRYYNGTGMVAMVGVRIGEYIIYQAEVTATSTTPQIILYYASAAIAGTKAVAVDSVYIGDGSYTTVAPDASGHGMHGTIYGPTPIDGDSGRALSFDGANDYCLATLPSAQNLLTLSIRAKVLATGGHAGLVSTFVHNGDSSGYGINLLAESAASARVQVGRTGTTYQYKDIAYNWDLTAEHDYKLIYDTTTRTASLWVDGVLKGTTTAFDATANPASDRIVVGRWAADYAGYYCQMIASHAIAYTRALSAVEVLGLYKAKTLPKSYTLSRWLADQAASDSTVTAAEKKSVLALWYAINGDGSTTGSYWIAIARAVALGLSSASEYTALVNARTALYNYLYSAPGVLAAFSWLSPIPITSATYNALWGTYYGCEVALNNKNAAEKAIDDIPIYAPKYLGLGQLADLATAAFAGYTISAPVITGGVIATNSALTSTGSVSPNVGDYMVNYAGAVAIKGTYKWSGSAWTQTGITADQRAAGMEDQHRLACLATPIVLAECATFDEVVAYQVTAQYLKAVKSIRVGGRYDKDGAIIDGTVPGFFAGAAGCKTSGLEFEGSQGGGVQWGVPSPTGTPFAINSTGLNALCAMTNQHIAFVNVVAKTLARYGWNGNTWSLSGSISLGDAEFASICALGSTRVVVLDSKNDKLRVYDWSGTAWSLYCETAITAEAFFPGLCALNSTTVAVYNTSKGRITVYSLSGTTWAQVGSYYSVGGDQGVLVSLSANLIIMFDKNNSRLRALLWSGSSFTELGNTIVPYYSGWISLAALNGTDIALYESTNDILRLYRWDGSSFTPIGAAGITLIAATGYLSMGAINGSDVVIHDGANLKVFRFCFALSIPYILP